MVGAGVLSLPSTFATLLWPGGTYVPLACTGCTLEAAGGQSIGFRVLADHDQLGCCLFTAIGTHTFRSGIAPSL